MKNILKQFPLISLAVLPLSDLLVCPSQNQNKNNFTRKEVTSARQRDSVPKINYKEGGIYAHAFDKSFKNVGRGTADLDVQMKDLVYKSR
ncbi:MAG TPA: hypothetical protein VFW07_28965 [Parafilimonas sp.]|nr:hypothetical protein [Parafilimonas sp.]